MVIATPPKVGIGHAHSKLILVGEHAVVYGKPAIAIPFPLEVTSTVESREGEAMLACTHYVGLLNQVPQPLKGIALCINHTLIYLGKPLSGLLIRLQSEIPMGRGLGSSAAIAVAIVRSLFSFYGRPLTQHKLMELVHKAEEYAHGNPSGIDMAATSSHMPIWFQRDRKVDPLTVGKALHLVVADSGKIGDTLSAVKKVKENYRLEPAKVKGAIEQVEQIAKLAKVALAKGDLHMLGSLLDANHDELRTMGVSDKGLNQLVETAKNEGALGAKLTGGGCGGCIMALANSLHHAEQLAKRLLSAGAYKTWYFTIENDT